MRVHSFRDCLFNISDICVYTFQWRSNKFIADLGGALSLWLGISIGLFFELIEFFLMLVENMRDHIMGYK